MTFIQHWGRRIGTKKIAVTPGEVMSSREIASFDGIVRESAVDFDVDTPVFEGDQLEWDDRGARRKVYAKVVTVHDQSIASSFMRHVSVKFSSKLPAQRRRSSGAGGHVIVVNGNNVNVAFDGSSISQQVEVSPAFGELADAVGRALALIERTEGIDPDEVEAARESATLILEETAKPEPDRSVVRKLILTLKGALSSAATAGAGAAASALVQQLMLPS